MAYTTINKVSDYFNTKLYTGNNTSTSYTGVGFQPDWIWIKDRSQAADHTLIDAVRGVKKVIISNSTNAEGTDSSTQGLNSFDSDGFTLGTNSNVGSTNNTGDNYVAWNWKANGQGSANSDGSINTTYTSANTTSGFSINLFTATGSAGTIGHGLNAVPKMILVKDTNGTGSWQVYHASLGATKYLALNENIAAGTASNRWNDTTPTSSVFSIGSEWSSGKTLIAYTFAEKTGFSKFGSYTGNSSTDGTFVYTGFKPAFLIQKRSDTTANWNMYDNKRSSSGGFNVVDDLFYVDGSNAEISYTSVDFLSNGFKFRSSDGALNTGANIFMAFAEAPLVGSNNVPATAR